MTLIQPGVKFLLLPCIVGRDSRGTKSVDFGTALSTNLAPSAEFACQKRCQAISAEGVKNQKKKHLFYSHPQHCDNICNTHSKKANHNNSTVFRSKKLADIRTICEISILFYSRGAIEKIFQKPVHRVSSGFLNSKTIKALDLRPRAFTSFLVF